MSSDLEDAIVASLRERHVRDVDTTSLLTGARARARRMRRRRGLLVTGAAVVAAGIVLAVPGLLLRTGAGSLGSPGATNRPGTGVTPPPPGGHQVPRLPVADGVPGAGSRPDLVGADPGLLHFDLDVVAAGASQVAWSAGSGHETADISLDGTRLRLDLGRDLAQLDSLSRIGGLAEIFGHGVAAGGGGNGRPQPRRSTTVDGRGATLDETRFDTGSVWVLRWQPVGELWARVEVAGSREDASWFAATVQHSLGSARRCVVPGQLTRLPVGLRWTGCGVILSGDNSDFAWGGSALVFAKADGTQVQLRLTGNAPIDAGEANTTVAGRPARWTSKGDLIVGDIGGGVGVAIHSALGRFTEPEAIDLAEAVRVSGDLNRPDSWPVPAVR